MKTRNRKVRKTRKSRIIGGAALESRSASRSAPRSSSRSAPRSSSRSASRTASRSASRSASNSPDSEVTRDLFKPLPFINKTSTYDGDRYTDAILAKLIVNCLIKNKKINSHFHRHDVYEKILPRVKSKHIDRKEYFFNMIKYDMNGTDADFFDFTKDVAKELGISHMITSYLGESFNV